MANNLKRAIDTDLGYLRTTERERAMILSNALEGKKVKKKFSVAFVLTMVLILATVTALAVTALSGYFSGYAQLEDAHGAYSSEWPTSAKVELVQLMQDSGLPVDQERTKELLREGLSEEQQETLVTEIIEAYFGSTEFMSTYNIMEHELGPLGGEGWTQEDMALYSALANEYGIGPSDHAQYVVPQARVDITKEQAIQLANQALFARYNITESDLSKYVITDCSFVVLVGNEPEWLLWYVSDDTTTYTNNTYSVRLSPRGEVIDTTAPTVDNPLNEEFARLIEARGLFVSWSLEEKYDFYQTWPSKVDTWMISPPPNTMPIRQYIHYLTGHAYALPDDESISEAAALQIAKDTLGAQEGLSSSEIDQFLIYKSFLLDAGGAQIWRWFFVPNPRIDNDCGYKIDIDAISGKVISVIHQFAGPEEENKWVSNYE